LAKAVLDADRENVKKIFTRKGGVNVDLEVLVKAFIRASVAAVGLFGASALASDLPTPAYKAQIAEATYNWSGFYVGANFGGAWTNGSLNIPGNNLYGGLTEFIGGVQADYNFQTGYLLFGIEADFDGAAFNHPTVPGQTLGSVSQRWISTMAGRVGLVNDRWLVFAKLGGGWVQSDASVSIPASPVWNGSNTSSGWLIGGGIEYGFKPHWTVKLEYDYLASTNWTSATLPAVALNRDVQMVKAGISYKFESGVAERAGPSSAGGSAEPSEDLQKQSQNPIADLVSVPFQSNTNFNTGPFNRTQEVLNIQPVVPMHLSEDWNLISRTIIPLISQPSPLFDSNTNGIGDITQSLFFSPAHPGALIWGVGPVFTVPSANDPILGTGKLLFGPTAVFLTTPGHWVIGVLLNNQWSVAGNPLTPSVNTFLAQPFLNYNMARGWYLTSSPIITSNWLAASGQQWTVPIGGGFGRVFKVEDQPVNAQIAGYYNVVRPTGTPAWQLRATLALLFPAR
jgi:opacity protein-like surface antigen